MPELLLDLFKDLHKKHKKKILYYAENVKSPSQIPKEVFLPVKMSTTEIKRTKPYKSEEDIFELFGPQPDEESKEIKEEIGESLSFVHLRIPANEFFSRKGSKKLKLSEEDKNFIKDLVGEFDGIYSYYDGKDHHIVFFKKHGDRGLEMLHIGEVCERGKCRRFLGKFYHLKHENIRTPSHVSEALKEGYYLSVTVKKDGVEPRIKLNRPFEGVSESFIEQIYPHIARAMGTPDPETLRSLIAEGVYHEELRNGSLTFGVHVPFQLVLGNKIVKVDKEFLDRVIESIYNHNKIRFSLEK